MHVENLLFEISRRGITLTCGCTEDRLNAKPTAALTPELIREIRQHKMEIINIMREDEVMRRTGVIQSERQVFELAREVFGGATGDPLADQILDALRTAANEGMTRMEISHLLGRNKSADSIARALAELLRCDHLYRQRGEVDGRIVERWFAT
jgi:hypothetical protein